MDFNLRTQSNSPRVPVTEQQENAGSSNGARVNSTLPIRTEGMSFDPNKPGTSGDTPSMLDNRTASVAELSDNNEIPFKPQNIYQDLPIKTDRDMSDYVQLPKVSSYEDLKLDDSFVDIQHIFLSDIDQLKALTKCFLLENFDEKIDTFYRNIQTDYGGNNNNLFRLYEETRFHLRCLLMDLEVCKDDDPSDPSRKDHAASVLYNCLESIDLCSEGVYSRFNSSYIDIRASKKGLSEKLLKIRKDLFDQCIASFMVEQQRKGSASGVTPAMEIHWRNTLHNLFCESLNIPSIEDSYANPNIEKMLTKEFKLLKELALSPSAILRKLVDEWSDQMSSILRREGASAWETEVMHRSDFTTDIIDILDNELFQPINGYLGRVNNGALTLTLLMDKKGNDDYCLLRCQEKLYRWVASNLDMSNDNHSSEPVTSSPRARARLWTCIPNNESVSNDDHSSESIVTVFAVIPGTGKRRNKLCIGTINRAFFWVFKPETPVNKGETCTFDTDNHITLELSHLSSINFSKKSEEVTYAIMTQALDKTNSPEDIASFFLHKNMSELAKRTQWIIKKLSNQLTDKLLHSKDEFKTVLCDCLCRTVLNSNARSASKERLGWLIDTPLLESVLLRLHKSRINTTPISQSLASWNIGSFSEDGIDKLLTPKDCRRLFRQACRRNQSGLVLRLLLTGHCDSIARLQKINQQTLLLFFATKSISSGVMHLLKRCNPEVNTQDTNGRTPLMYLASAGQTACLHALLERGANVNARSLSDTTALMCAAYKGHLGCIKWLLNKKNICINDRSLLGYTALIWAVRGDHAGAVKLLLRAKGISVNVWDAANLTALDWAIALEHSECIEALVTDKNLLLMTKQPTDMMPLFLVAAKGFLKGLHALLKAPILDINAMDPSGFTVLHHAVMTNQLACLKVILTVEGVDVNAKRTRGYLDDSMTPLMYAANKGYLGCIKVLLEQVGILLNAQSDSKRTALIWAVMGGHVESVKALLSAEDIWVNLMDDHGFTALDWAINLNHLACIRAIVAHPHFLINLPKSNGMRLLHFVARKCSIDVVRALLESPTINVNAKDYDGFTALHHAVKARNEGCLKELVTVGIDTNATDNNGFTALHHAAVTGWFEGLDVLLAKVI